VLIAKFPLALCLLVKYLKLTDPDAVQRLYRHTGACVESMS
jgi:hypothetical protein